MSSKSPGPKRNKQLLVKVVMLDDSEVPFQIEAKTTGNELINLVYQYLKLVESDYFGLEYLDLKGKKVNIIFIIIRFSLNLANHNSFSVGSIMIKQSANKSFRIRSLCFVLNSILQIPVNWKKNIPDICMLYK